MNVDWAQLLFKAVIVGVMTVVLGYIVGFVTKPFVTVNVPVICSQWNKNYAMEINLFLIGFTSRIIIELINSNTGMSV